jgi:hypothetical protein
MKISPAGDGLYEARLFGVILQDLADLTDRAVDAVVGIEEDVLTPYPLYDVFPADDLSFLLDEDGENFRGNALQLKDATGTAQCRGGEIELEVLAKSDQTRNSDWL